LELKKWGFIISIEERAENLYLLKYLATMIHTRLKNYPLKIFIV